MTNGEVYDKFSHGSHLRSGEGGRTPRQKTSRTRRSLSLSPPLTDDGAAADTSLHEKMSETHTVSSRHRKTVANTRGSPQKADLTFGGVTAAVLLKQLSPNYALAQQVAEDDPDISTEMITYNSPNGHGEINAYMVTPAGGYPGTDDEGREMQRQLDTRS